MDCKDCGRTAAVPFYEVEAEREKNRAQLNWVAICSVLTVMIALASMVFVYMINRDCMNKIEEINKYWLDFLGQYDIENYSYDYDYSQDGKGLNIIGDNNGVDYNGPAFTQETAETDDDSERWQSSWEDDEEAEPQGVE